MSYPPCLSIRVCDPIKAKSIEGFRRIGAGVLRRPSVDLYSNNPHSLLFPTPNRYSKTFIIMMPLSRVWVGILSVVSIILVNASSVRVSERCTYRCLSASNNEQVGCEQILCIYTVFACKCTILITKVKKGEGLLLPPPCPLSVQSPS